MRPEEDWPEVGELGILPLPLSLSLALSELFFTLALGFRDSPFMLSALGPPSGVLGTEESQAKSCRNWGKDQ